ncbi:DNA-binding transcriptional LysR family regulator [Paenibacillus polymyxa]|uniref:hypothetical protein n=1 Tax=Paenibacillus polymyxa TaxID=1406 RepID=UPI00278F850F|nr:hypothetical protein [Paenibacillus polymyxa]MDQ0050180.1 DNA-binding transcriptional LysR family regulator [Paenibacillus polymyxa]
MAVECMINAMGELLAKPMLFFDVGCTHRTRAESFLSEAGVDAYQIMEFGTLEVILGGVASGLGGVHVATTVDCKGRGGGKYCFSSFT